MKKLIIASTLLALSALPAIAKSDKYDIPDCENTYGRECRGATITAQYPNREYEPERRERHAQDDEILSNCVNTNKNLYCAEQDDGAGIWQINDNQLYQNCNQLGCVKVEGDSFIRSENGELIQVNPGNEGE